MLVVDDNRDADESVAMHLEEFGHDIRMTCDGPTALEVTIAIIASAARALQHRS